MFEIKEVSKVEATGAWAAIGISGGITAWGLFCLLPAAIAC